MFKFVVRKFNHQLIDNITNTTELKGSRDEQKGKLKQKFAQLTEDDLLFDEGKKDEMPGKLQVKPGKNKDDWFKILSDNNRQKQNEHKLQNKMYIFI
jgi:uncharacterized protein YjbJ (UPF0337 family)